MLLENNTIGSLKNKTIREIINYINRELVFIKNIILDIYDYNHLVDKYNNTEVIKRDLKLKNKILNKKNSILDRLESDKNIQIKYKKNIKEYYLKLDVPEDIIPIDYKIKVDIKEYEIKDIDEIKNKLRTKVKVVEYDFKKNNNSNKK